MPENFSPGSIWKRDDEKIPNDKFVYNLISKYAKEGKNEEDGKPSGKFFIDRAAAKTVTEPYVKKYVKVTGKDLEDVMTMEFEDKFKYIDVLDSGFIEVEQMGRFVRSMCHDNTLDLQKDL